MCDLIDPANAALLGLLHTPGALEEPFSREVYLLSTYVAGTTYIPGIEELEPFIQPGDRLAFVRDPDNVHDALAIRVENAHGVKLGWVPRDDNPVFARLMDAGKLLFGRVTKKEWKEKWLRIDFDIYLED